jgi:hypothetical protein
VCACIRVAGLPVFVGQGRGPGAKETRRAVWDGQGLREGRRAGGREAIDHAIEPPEIHYFGLNGQGRVDS